MTRIVETVLAVALIVLMAAIGLQVLCSALDINPVARFEAELPLLGRAVTLNSLLDMQWHLLVIVGLCPAGMVWLTDRHVRVDFLHQRFAPRWRARIDMLGAVVFAAPFFALMLPASLGFLMRAWASDEGSRNGGLNDLWLIKAALPLGLAAMAVCVAIETIRLARAAR